MSLFHPPLKSETVDFPKYQPSYQIVMDQIDKRRDRGTVIALLFNNIKKLGSIVNQPQ